MVGNGEHLGLVLSRFGIMQKDAAAAMGVDPAMVTRWKRGTERLSADSPRMAVLVDFLLSPNGGLSEGDLRWLRSRFAEEDIEVNAVDVVSLREALANYLANDGSRIREGRRQSQRLFMQDQFALAGVGAVVEALRSELARAGAGRPFYVVSTAAGIETESAFLRTAAGIVQRGTRLRLLVGNTNGSEADCATQAYLPFVSSPDVQVRFVASANAPLFYAGFCTTLLVPGRLCLHVTRAVAGAAPVACGIRSAAYLNEIEREIADVWSQAISAFENPRETTPRIVSGSLARFYRETGGLAVASDGLNPVFMSVRAFERLLESRGLNEDEIAWRVEAFEREQQGLEDQIARGVPYHEMTTAVDASIVREQGTVAVYGTTLIDSRSVDVETAQSILQGYLRFATLYPHFDVRFANPSRELANGLWMLCEPPLSIPPHDDAGGVVLWQWEEGSVRQLVSHHPRIMGAVRELFWDTWDHLHFRVWHEGRLVTSNDEADPSLTIRFIREKIDELNTI